jgi:hypothetical protein
MDLCGLAGRRPREPSPGIAPTAVAGGERGMGQRRLPVVTCAAPGRSAGCQEGDLHLRHLVARSRCRSMNSTGFGRSVAL